MENHANRATEQWRIDWASNAELQKEYPTAEAYIAVMRGTNDASAAALEKAWEASADLQREFPTAAAYVAMKKRGLA